MARTTKRGGFTMQSGNNTSFKAMGSETPYPFLKGLGKAILGGPLAGIKSIIDKRKENKAAEAATGAVGGAGGSSDEKLKAITQILSSDEGGVGMGTGTIGGLGAGATLGGLAAGEGTALTKKKKY